jgi:hypothetical protein
MSGIDMNSPAFNKPGSLAGGLPGSSMADHAMFSMGGQDAQRLIEYALMNDRRAKFMTSVHAQGMTGNPQAASAWMNKHGATAQLGYGAAVNSRIGASFMGGSSLDMMLGAQNMLGSIGGSMNYMGLDRGIAGQGGITTALTQDVFTRLQDRFTTARGGVDRNRTHGLDRSEIGDIMNVFSETGGLSKLQGSISDSGDVTIDADWADKLNESVEKAAKLGAGLKKVFGNKSIRELMQRGSAITGLEFNENNLEEINRRISEGTTTADQFGINRESYFKMQENMTKYGMQLGLAPGVSGAASDLAARNSAGAWRNHKQRGLRGEGMGVNVETPTQDQVGAVNMRDAEKFTKNFGALATAMSFGDIQSANNAQGSAEMQKELAALQKQAIAAGNDPAKIMEVNAKAQNLVGKYGGSFDLLSETLGANTFTTERQKSWAQAAAGAGDVQTMEAVMDKMDYTGLSEGQAGATEDALNFALGTATTDTSGKLQDLMKRQGGASEEEFMKIFAADQTMTEAQRKEQARKMANISQNEKTRSSFNTNYAIGTSQMAGGEFANFQTEGDRLNNMIGFGRQSKINTAFEADKMQAGFTDSLIAGVMGGEQVSNKQAINYSVGRDMERINESLTDEQKADLKSDDPAKRQAVIDAIRGDKKLQDSLNVGKEYDVLGEGDFSKDNVEKLMKGMNESDITAMFGEGATAESIANMLNQGGQAGSVNREKFDALFAGTSGNVISQGGGEFAGKTIYSSEKQLEEAKNHMKMRADTNAMAKLGNMDQSALEAIRGDNEKDTAKKRQDAVIGSMMDKGPEHMQDILDNMRKTVVGGERHNDIGNAAVGNTDMLAGYFTAQRAKLGKEMEAAGSDEGKKKEVQGELDALSKQEKEFKELTSKATDDKMMRLTGEITLKTPGGDFLATMVGTTNGGALTPKKE